MPGPPHTHTPQRIGILCVVSGPSGSGKTTVCRKVSALRDAHYAVSCTTRHPRRGEVDGKDYHFLSHKAFERKIVGGELLEHAEVHGQLYGTLQAPVLSQLMAGRDVLMDIDVLGAAQIRACTHPTIRRALVDVFITPPDLAELRRRLAGRGTETEEQLDLRLHNAVQEVRHWPDYSYTIRSGTKEEDFQLFQAILDAESCRSSRLFLPALVPQP